MRQILLRISLFYSLLFFLGDLYAQAPKILFPQSWIGNWTGTLEIYQGLEKKQEVPMTLQIHPTDSTHIWQWTLIYGQDSTADIREYLLIEQDSAKGEYVIDERNSIILNANLHGNVLSSRFLVNHSLLLINYQFEIDHLIFDVFVGPDNQSILTGEEVDGVEKIEAWSIKSRQRAVLRKD